MREINVWTDGSSKIIDGKRIGAYAYSIEINGEELCCGSDWQEDATNQQMELLAAIKGLEAVQNFRARGDKIILISDSAYLINCVNGLPGGECWYRGWLSNGWVNAKGEPVKNKEFWEQLIPYFESTGYVFKKVKGHDSSFWNNKVDKLAQASADEGKAYVKRKLTE